MAKKLKVLHVRVTEGFYRKLERLARREKRTKSDLVRLRMADAAK